MRPTLLAGILLTAWPGIAAAQNTPYRATVSDAEVLLRAGPSDKYPDTGTLKRGTEVVVHEESNGWLAVQAPGAISWVPTQFIDFDKTQKIPQNVTTQDEVTLAAGKVGVAQPLTDARLTRLPAGTILKVIGTPEKFDNKTWYPVEPLLGDYRYLPKTAVQAAGAVNTSFVVRETPPPGRTPDSGAGARVPSIEGAPLGGGAAPSTAPVVNNPLWTQAETAEREGRLDDAEKLYFQLARVMNEPGGDHDIANLCYTRIHTLREKKRSGSTTAPANPAGSPRRDTTVTRTDSPRDVRPTLLPPVRNDQVVSTGALPPAAADGREAWTGAGMLRSSALVPDGRTAYAFESSPGVVRMYVIAAPGVDLKPFVNRKVDLFGTTGTRKDLSKPFIIVSNVNPNP
jgi:hypothetical protein